MTAKEVNVLLEQINVLVDNAGGMAEQEIHAAALELQRLAANLPRLAMSAIAGWESARLLAIAYGAAATEDTADQALAELRRTRS